MNNKGFSQSFSALIVFIFLVMTACASQNNQIVKEQAEASKNLGEAYMNQGNYTAALKELLEAERKNPNDPAIQNSLGLAYMAKGRPELSIKHFQKALELQPDLSPAINNLGNAYLRLNQWDKAIEQFKFLTNDLLYATPHFPLTNLGFAYYCKGNYKEAERYYLEALALQPKFVVALRGLGRAYMKMEELEKAQEFLNEAISNDPLFAPAYMDLARIHLLLGETEKAKKAYQQVISIAPESSLAKEARQNLKPLSD
jgi:Tfp pilus assembly protein PilF